MSFSRRTISALALVLASSLAFAAEPPKATPAADPGKQVDEAKKPEAAKKDAKKDDKKKAPAAETAPKRPETPKSEGC